MLSAARIFLSLAILGLLACSVSEDLTETERALLLTEADFGHAGHVPGSAPVGRYRKTINRLAQSRELSYVYEKEGAGFYLSNTLTVDTSPANALITEKAHKTGLLIGLGATGIAEEPMDLRSKYGERSSLTALKKDGKPVGNVFTAVGGKNVYIVIFSGVYFDDASRFESFIDGKIDAVLKYEPAK